MKKEYIVKNSGVRLDKALAELDKDLSRMMIQKLIEENKVVVNKKIEKPSYKVKENDIIELEVEKPKESKLKPEEIDLNVIYEDNDIIIINKAKGMVVHPGNGNPEGTLANAVMARCKDSLSGIGGEIRPGIVHRIDKDTSGVIIVAKNDKAHINISNQIKEHKTKKTYLALVRGIVKENEATIDMPIGRSQKDRKKMAVTKTGKNAITHIKVLKRYKENTLLEVNIETGRTHQIRVHLSEIGYPLIGDTTYSNGKNKWGIKGQCLHAKSLRFKHPATEKEMYLEAKGGNFEEIVRRRKRMNLINFSKMNQT